MKLHQTARALLARGLPSNISTKLVNQGFTLSKLKQMTKTQLSQLELEDSFIEKIQTESRPPINSKVLNELLFESRFCCCVCRDTSKPIVIHHIDSWENSHSHKKENLAVLCPYHHDEAHTRHGLTISLTRERLISIKELWIKDVQESDSNTILSILDRDFACWDFFNLNRIFELSKNFNILYRQIRTYQYLYQYGYINIDGYITPINSWPHKPRSYWLDMLNGMYISDYLRAIFVQMIPLLPFKILNYIWKKAAIKSNCRPGDFVVVQGAFYFKDTTLDNGNIRLGYRHAQGVQLEFIFDSWYCTSCSSKYDHLAGRRVATVFAIIREIEEDLENDLLKIKCTALAIGSYFNPIYDGRFFIDDSIYEDSTNEW